ncbi:hypothetical protein BDQ17DRAFT_1441442 [Cyathus striatus]|nr:hypothetical protein BDQ17DRAFT_1441442 [Cyathus striatus]
MGSRGQLVSTHRNADFVVRNLQFSHGDITLNLCILVNISYAYENATLESAYHNLPLQRNGKPDLGVLLTKFFLQPEATRLRIGAIERFSGYCGEHISQYIEVLSESSQNMLPQPSISLGKRVCALEPIPIPKRLQSSSPAATQVKRVRFEKKKAKEPETAVLEPDTTLDVLLRRLGEGSGFTSYKAEGFLEACTRCGLHYLPGTLRQHILDCSETHTD